MTLSGKLILIWWSTVVVLIVTRTTAVVITRGQAGVHSSSNGELDEEAMHPMLPLANFVERSGSVNYYEDPVYWRSLARQRLRTKLRERPIEKKAKNIIFFLGDGMSIPTITAARIFKGQMENLTYGEEAVLTLDQFPFTGVSKTYCANSQVGDSACTSTAYFCGSKGNYRTIGVTPDVQENDCTAQMNPLNQVSSIITWAQEAGMSTGIVTNTRITHASPAGGYSHVAHRNWEHDDAVTSAGFDPAYCDDIAEQLVLNSPGRDINVILGGGRSALLPRELLDIEDHKRGKRKDGKNLIDTWILSKRDSNGQYVTNRRELLSVNTSSTNYLLGLFAYDHMQYADGREAANDPSLEEMTEVAIKILSKNPKGFFLFVEGGKIDHAHHATNAKRALYETLDFDRTIKRGLELTSEEDTMVVVTSDHSHVMTISGYAERGHSVLGIGGISNIDGLPYTTLSYANGPGYRQPTKTGKRKNIRSDNMESLNYRQIATVPMIFETHGGDDVLIFSSGPFAHLLNGIHDQSYIPHAMAYGACIGHGEKFCDDYHHLSGAR